MGERVMFVDDEQNVLSAVKRMLFEEEYESRFSLSGEDALTKLKSDPVEVIVSDMRMPGMNGVEFLKRSRETCPDAVRIVLSGQSDVNEIMESINQGGIWRYISKPWDDRDFKITIRNAIDLYKKDRERVLLLEELERKNCELNLMNERLEMKVEERTKLINAQVELLNILVESNELDELFSEAFSRITSLTGALGMHVYRAFGKLDFVSFGSAADRNVYDLLKTVVEGDPKKIPENCLIRTLSKSNVLLGSILLDGIKNPEMVKEVEKNIFPILSLALSEQKVILDTPDLLNDIDDLIGKI